MDWTLASLTDELGKHDQTLILSFETPEGRAGPGFHVTEFKAANVRSIDCGGNLNSWTEVGLQLKDGFANTPMSLRKFGAISDKSMRAVKGLADNPIYVEFAHKNEGLARYSIAGLHPNGDRLVVELASDQAVCKPMKRSINGCCGAGRHQQQNCC